MKAFRYGDNLETGQYAHATAYDAINNGIRCYKLTEEEAEETCYFGYGESECSTCACAWSHKGGCKHYFTVNKHGEIEEEE